MSKPYKLLHIIPIGFAMFSMFFGSGNVIFPVLVGAKSSIPELAFIGLFITAIALPFAGLIAMFMFKGNYFNFFIRLGKPTSWFIILSIMS